MAMDKIKRLYRVSPRDVMNKTFFVVANNPTSAQQMAEKAYADWDYGEYSVKKIECIAENDQYSDFDILL
jgi:hypothetical protein